MGGAKKTPKDPEKVRLKRTIGNAARSLRVHQGMSQEEAAALIGMSAEYYARIERAEALPSALSLKKIADAYKTSTDALLGREPTQAPPAPEPDSLDLRRLVRRLQKARPKTIRLLDELAKELESKGRR